MKFKQKGAVIRSIYHGALGATRTRDLSLRKQALSTTGEEE